jgi:hypothetical protein
MEEWPRTTAPTFFLTVLAFSQIYCHDDRNMAALFDVKIGQKPILSGKGIQGQRLKIF